MVLTLSEPMSFYQNSSFTKASQFSQLCAVTDWFYYFEMKMIRIISKIFENMNPLAENLHTARK